MKKARMLPPRAVSRSEDLEHQLEDAHLDRYYYFELPKNLIKQYPWPPNHQTLAPADLGDYGRSPPRTIQTTTTGTTADSPASSPG